MLYHCYLHKSYKFFSHGTKKKNVVLKLCATCLPKKNHTLNQFLAAHFIMKMSFKKLFTILTFTMCSIYMTNGLICKGCIELDELTFDKVIGKFSTVLVKFDIAFPYGKKHDEYAKFATEIGQSDINDMVVCVVGIKNYGESTNTQLSERFYVNDQLPVIKLFTNYNTQTWIDFRKGWI